MKKRILKFSGIAVLILALCANLQYALFNYGLKDGKLSMAIMAQSSSSNTNSTGTGTGTNDGLLQHEVATTTACTTTKTTQEMVGNTPVTAHITYSGTNIDCQTSGLNCSKHCGNFTNITTSYTTN